MSLFKGLKFKIVLLEVLALIFIINGLQRLYMASQGANYEALMNNNWELFESLTSLTIGQFLLNRAIWTLIIILFSITVIGFINRMNKIKIINSVLVFLFIIGISVTGFFMKGVTNNYLNYFCGLFSHKYGTSFFIGGIILTTFGITILWHTIFRHAQSLNLEP